MKTSIHISVGRRLARLAIAEIITAVGLVLLGLLAGAELGISRWLSKPFHVDHLARIAGTELVTRKR